MTSEFYGFVRDRGNITNTRRGFTQAVILQPLNRDGTCEGKHINARLLCSKELAPAALGQFVEGDIQAKSQNLLVISNPNLTWG